MFRRRTSSSGKIHYRINIDKSMCPNPVDIYIDGDMIKDTMERDMINEISTLFVMIFTSGLMFVMPILDVGYNDIIVIIGLGIILSFMLTIIPILLSYDIRDEIIELIEDLDNQIVIDTSVYKTNLP